MAYIAIGNITDQAGRVYRVGCFSGTGEVAEVLIERVSTLTNRARYKTRALRAT